MGKIYSYFDNLPLIRYQWVRQFIKFSIVGGVCTIFDFGIYLFLTRLFSFWRVYYLWANFVAVISAATINFIWNRKWTFRVRQGSVFWQYLKFWLAVLLGILVYQSILYLSVERLNWGDMLGKILGAIFAWLLRFIFNKFWTFK